MKKTIFICLLSAIISSAGTTEVYSEGISAKSAIVYEPFSETVLFEKAADERMLVASTTKIMTAAIVIENCGLDEKVEVGVSHASVEGSSMYLRPGEDYTVGELLYGLMLASGNDAAAALADHVAGSMEDFAALMNEKCERLGLENTHFVNSHGLDAAEHYSSARDLAVITAYAMENPVFCEIFSCGFYTVKGAGFSNHNKLLTSCQGCIGGKTGYTEKAGRVLVSCVERDGMRLICVTISAPDDWDDHRELYDRCFEEYEYIPVLGESEKMELISGVCESSRICCEKPGIAAEKADEVSIRLHLPRFAFAPVLAGEKAGYAEIIQGGKTVDRLEIFYAETVPLDEKLSRRGLELIFGN